MKKRLIMLGLGLAVVGTGMVINKLRKRNNEEEVNEVEETIETEEAMDVEIVEEMVIDNEEETIIYDNDEIEIIDCKENEFEQRCWFRRKIVRPVLVAVTFVTLTLYKNYKIIKNEVKRNKDINERNKEVIKRFRYDYKNK
jgi:hypothetical protein